MNKRLRFILVFIFCSSVVFALSPAFTPLEIKPRLFASANQTSLIGKVGKYIASPVRENTSNEIGFLTGFTENLKDIELVEIAPLHTDFHNLSEFRAEQGVRNLEPYSVLLTNMGKKAYKQNRKSDAITFFNNAKELSPDLPTPYFYLAKTNFTFSLKGFSTASGYLLDAWTAFLNNFWWTFQTAQVVLISLFLACYLSIIVFLVVMMSSKFRLYVHDVTEDRKKILLLIPLIILVFFGPIFGVISIMLPFWRYLKRKERAMFYFMILLLIGIVFYVPLLSSFLYASQDSIFHSIVRINKGVYSTDEFSDTSRIKRSYEGIFTYALDLKRKGYYSEAITLYEELLKQREDAKIYNNLANCYVGLNNYDKAVEYYNRALQLKEMASSYYNLSQINREIFSFSDAGKYYDKAINTDSHEVAFYNSVRGVSVNRFVMDEPLSNNELWSLGFKHNTYHESSVSLLRMLSFTREEVSAGLLILLMFTFYIYRKGVSRGAYRCRRCGEIFCSKCEKKISREDICIRCFKTMAKTGEIKSKEKLEKILAGQLYRDNRNKNLKVLTLILPGSGHIYYGWYVSGFLILLLFTFFLVSAMLWFYIPAPVSMNKLASFFILVSVFGCIAVYATAVINIFRRMPRRWL